jgi:ribosomal protein S18 acetylase RimI-like enzyme
METGPRAARVADLAASPAGTLDMRIARWVDLGNGARAAANPDVVFFSSSNTQAFDNAAQRSAFRAQWLGQFLDVHPDLAVLALDPAGACAGYCVVWPDDPRTTGDFRGLDYFGAASDAVSRFPAHLHINLAEGLRGNGLGSRLLAAALARLDAARPGTGVHIFTEANARNRSFYRHNGFDEILSVPWRERRLVMMARDNA